MSAPTTTTSDAAATEALVALSPLDGRYVRHTRCLRDFFSEFALFRYRVKVEVLYLCALATRLAPAHMPSLAAAATPDRLAALKLRLIDNFTVADAAAIKQIERTTNHDIKAVEYFVKERMAEVGLGGAEALEYVHFGLTSQDINNTAIPMMLADALRLHYLPTLRQIVDYLVQEKIAPAAVADPKNNTHNNNNNSNNNNNNNEEEAEDNSWANTPMLAHTHGQPASPTTLAKEYFVFVERLREQIHQLEAIPASGKFGGATGNFNAHLVAFPEIDWRAFADTFLAQDLGLRRQQTTTQIEHYDNLAAVCHAVVRINTILTDLARDTWEYISKGYFKQKVKAGEVGSSAMPHKVNPIDFENAEGNLGVASALLTFLAAKLPISRLQRDLTDSTVLRGLGVPIGHCLVAHASLLTGLRKLRVDRARLAADLEANWAVVAEALQTILRRAGYPQPYERLKDLTRGRPGGVTAAQVREFIQSLEGISDATRAELAAVTPLNYTGYPVHPGAL